MSILSEPILAGFRIATVLRRSLDNAAAGFGFERRFFASKGQDRWVAERALPKLANGYFVEVGAGDGRTYSNTYALERYRGWSGLLIEPNPTYTQRIKATRRAQLVADCADRDNGFEEFLPLGYVGGIIADDTDNSTKHRAGVIRRNRHKIIQVRCRTLASILDDAGAPTTIDYLSIDVEGSEYRVLRSFPFHRYRFQALTVERPTGELHKLLVDAGYVLDRVYLFDGFYVSGAIAAELRITNPSFVGCSQKFF